jgi:hypothetical protein
MPAARCFTGRFDTPPDAVREHGTYGGRRQSRQAWGARAALLFLRSGQRICDETENEVAFETEHHDGRDGGCGRRRLRHGVMPVAEVRALCRSVGASGAFVACAWVSDVVCHIVLPNDEPAPVSTYRRHEIAHCNGWPENYPNGGRGVA